MYGDKDRLHDFEFFVKHYDDIFKQYGHTFVVIQNEHILGTYPSFGKALEVTQRTHTLGTFIVQECNGDESGYTNYISSWELLGVK